MYLDCIQEPDWLAHHSRGYMDLVPPRVTRSNPRRLEVASKPGHAVLVITPRGHTIRLDELLSQ